MDSTIRLILIYFFLERFWVWDVGHKGWSSRMSGCFPGMMVDFSGGDRSTNMFGSFTNLDPVLLTLVGDVDKSRDQGR